jgi:hypothetical protein
VIDITLTCTYLVRQSERDSSTGDLGEFLRTLCSEDVDIQNEQLLALTQPPLNRRQIMCTHDGTVASGAGRMPLGESHLQVGLSRGQRHHVCGNYCLGLLMDGR